MASVCPVAGIIHMPMTRDKNQRPLGRLRGSVLRHWYKNHPYKILFSSEGGEREFLDYYKLDLATGVLSSGTTLTKEKASRQAAREALNDPWLSSDGPADGLPILGDVCQFVPQKNLHMLVDAWRWAASHGAPSRLLLIGDGPQRKELEERLATVDKSLWKMTGWGEHYVDYMAQLDIFIMPSLFEGLPLSFLEAVGMGLPSIVSDFNGASDVAAQANWVDVVNPLTVETLGEAIAKAVKQPAPEVREEQRQAFINYFSPARMGRDFLKIFQTQQ